MDFKEMLNFDLENTFLNLEEFGEEHEIDGENVVCVIDSDNLREKQGLASKAIAEADKMLFVKSEDVPYQKGYGETLMLDGVPYVVQTWDSNMGLTTITLTIAFSV